MFWEIPFRKNDIKRRIGVGRPCEFDDKFLKAILEQNPRQALDIAKRMYASQSTILPSS